MSSPKTAVLVHGGFEGGWCWARVAAPLHAKGWRVFSPSLSGLGDRAHLLSPDISFATHVQDVVGIIEAEELREVVLVGHSAGGTVITAVADRVSDQIAALVYLDASLPESGQSMFDFMGDSQGVPELFRSQAADRGEGWRVPAGPPFDAAGFGIEDPADQAWFNRRMTDHPLAAFVDPIHLTGAWEKVATKIYLRCEQFQIAHGEPTISKVEADPSWHTERWDCGHSPHITDPQRVVAAIEAAVG
ncbi:MAG: alpha/beta fold hydrolase [Sporichthyaceae bacterium]